MLGAVFWLAASRRDRATRAGRRAAACRALGSAADPLWLRDGSARIRIEPHDIVMVTSAGNYVEYCMAGGRTHLMQGNAGRRGSAADAAYNIVRVHRTRLVNLARVSALKAGPSGDFELTLDTGQVVSGSRRYRERRRVGCRTALDDDAPARRSGDPDPPLARQSRSREPGPQDVLARLYKTLPRFADRLPSSPGYTKALLFAPRLMLERGLTVHRAPFAQARRRLIRPFILPGLVSRTSPDETRHKGG